MSWVTSPVSPALPLQRGLLLPVPCAPRLGALVQQEEALGCQIPHPDALSWSVNCRSCLGEPGLSEISTRRSLRAVSHCPGWEEPGVSSQSRQPSLSSIPRSLPVVTELGAPGAHKGLKSTTQEQPRSPATPRLSLENSWNLLFNSVEFCI